MNDKKNIDRLFQEKFKDFEVTPPDAVWEKIKAQQQKDKKRIVILPLWYRIGGIAALIAILFSISNFLFTGDTSEKEELVIDQEIETKPTSSDDIIKLPIDTHTSIVDNSSDTDTKKITNNTPMNTSTTNQIKSEFINPKGSQTKNITTTNPIPPSTKESIATHSRNIQKTTVDHTHNTSGLKNIIPSTTTTKNNHHSIVQNATSKDIQKEQKTTNDPNKLLPKNPTPITDTNNTAITDIANETHKNTENATDQKDGQKSIFDAIQEKKDKESITTIESSDKKWNIAPTIAPVYYSSLGNGSSIDTEFADNTKQGQVNFSYGIQIAYTINKKLSIRSGINKLDLAYNTEDVGFGIQTRSNNIILSNNLDPSNIQHIIVSDFIPQQTDDSPSPALGIDNRGNLFKAQNPGLLNHSLEYIEVPVEVTYALTDTKLGVHMIGGVSTLFLEEEHVSITAGNFKNTNIERDDTVNDLSFSANLGIGIDYKLTDQFRIHMEPIFKYQLNGFKDSAQGFKPYYFGVYTGISIKF